MHAIKVQIERFVDAHQPGFVECTLIDAQGRRHIFVEKVPVVSHENLCADSVYPRNGFIACELNDEIQDAEKGLLISIDTDQPWSVESTEGTTKFIVLASQITTV